MKRITLSIVLVMILLSCNSNKNQDHQTTSQSDTLVDQSNKGETASSDQSSLDIANIPVSDKELGVFPFFSVPKDLAIQNGKGSEYKFTKFFFPINGKLTPLEGRAWMGSIVKADYYNEQWSDAYFDKSYSDAIESVGGVKIFEGKVARDEYYRVKDEIPNVGEPGSMDYLNADKVKVYQIRRLNGDDVYIQYTSNGVFGSLQVLQKEAFQQTITLLKSDEIKKQLAADGKAVLYINFDTDKATLKPDGIEAVKEIIRVLSDDSSLKIAINGYTDNAGSKAHNQELSENRASAVKTEILKAGIASDRLTSKGFGQDNPIADNNTAEGKAQNRRVELVKQ